MEQLINQYNNSLQNLEDAIASAERIHRPNVLAARKAVVNASSDTWDLKEVKKGYNKYATIFNESLIAVNISNNSIDINNKKDIDINVVEDLRRKLVNNDTLDSMYIFVNNTSDDTDIRVKISNNTFEILYDSYQRTFQYNISKNNLLYILNKLIELYYSRN